MMIISFTNCNDIHRKHKHHHHKKHHHHHKHHHSYRHRHSRSRSASPPRNRNSQAALEEVLASESTAAEKLRRLHLEGLSNLAGPESNSTAAAKLDDAALAAFEALNSEEQDFLRAIQQSIQTSFWLRSLIW